MANYEDKIFLRRFSGIIAGLVIVTILIIIIANFSDSDIEPGANPSRAELADERTRPVGAVRTELPEEIPPVATVPAATAPAPVEDIDGGAVFAEACQACHATGAAGAPIPGSPAWQERVAKGFETLAANAINGINAMPPKGGRLDLSDAEVTAAVEHMLAQ